MVELRLWLARCITEPSTSPDRWYARILNAILKDTGPADNRLRPRSRYETLTTTLQSIAAQAAAQADAIFHTLLNLGR